MRSTFRIITILCFGLLLTGGAEAQQRSKSQRRVRITRRSTPPPPRVEYLTPDRPRPLPFSDAVRVGHMLYLSGQIGTAGALAPVPGGIKAETKQTMENIRRVLERNGSSLDQVVKCTVMLADMSEWSAMNEIYVTYFAKDRLPARSAMGVNGLALGARVEIECWATLNNDGRTPSALTAEQAAATMNSVRAFARTVSYELTRRGPAAWRDYFAETPAFFMAAEGHLVFANTDAATRGIHELSGSIAHMELSWGEPLLIDPLTPTIAMLAAPYHEIRVDNAGHRAEENGYFTGLAELGPAGWRFRNAHWSVVSSPPAVP